MQGEGHKERGRGSGRHQRVTLISSSASAETNALPQRQSETGFNVFQLTAKLLSENDAAEAKPFFMGVLIKICIKNSIV